MNSVIAKFETIEKKPSSDGESQEIIARAVTSGSPENDEFFKYTPGGELTLQVVGHEAAAFFEPGREFFVTFSDSR